MSTAISCRESYAELGLPTSALLIDVRSGEACATEPRMIPGAIHRSANRVDEWALAVPHARAVVVYAQDVDSTTGAAAAQLAAHGYRVHELAGGLDAWVSAGYPTVRMRSDLNSPGRSRWITRERPKIDRLACPWLIRRFIDPEAQFFYTPPQRVRADASSLRAEPFDIMDVAFSHRGPRCSFDAFLEEFDLHDPVIDEIADIVRAADTGVLHASREAPGLLAISLGLSANIAEDIALLEHAMPIYDALYAWRKKASHETHAWPQPQNNA